MYMVIPLLQLLTWIKWHLKDWSLSSSTRLVLCVVLHEQLSSQDATRQEVASILKCLEGPVKEVWVYVNQCMARESSTVSIYWYVFILLLLMLPLFSFGFVLFCLGFFVFLFFQGCDKY